MPDLSQTVRDIVRKALKEAPDGGYELLGGSILVVRRLGRDGSSPTTVLLKEPTTTR